MNEDEIRLTTDNLIIQASALYGCPLPHTELLASYISDAIVLEINEEFSDLSDLEINYALRLNLRANVKNPNGEHMDTIEFFGNHINVFFLVKIIEKYYVLRYALDRKLQNFIDGYSI